MRRRNENLAQVLEFWRAVEMLDPLPVPAVLPSEPVFPVYAELALPWESDHETHRTPLPPGMTWRHTVYGGIYPLRRFREFLEREFGAEPEPVDARRTGDSALFAITVTDEGRPLLDSLELSAAAWVSGRTSGSAGSTARRGKAAGRKAPRKAPDREPDGADAADAAGAADASTRADAGGEADPARPEPPGWWDGFVQSAAACDREFRRLFAASRDDARTTEMNARLKRDGVQVGRPIGYAQLAEFCDRVEAEFAVQTALRPGGIRVRSMPVPDDASRGEEVSAAFGHVTSGITGDLTRVALAARDGDYGAALDAYLGGAKSAARDRIDVRKDPSTVYEGVAPELVPTTRWPSASGRALSLSQQFTVNTVLADLAPGAGLFSVNGPPGTGKTTALKDLVAAVVVQRARRLAALPTTYAAFGQTLRWQSAEQTRVISTWKAQLTGFEMVLAAADEDAADTAVRETSRRSEIDEEWHAAAGYFAELGTRMLAAAAQYAAGEPASPTLAGEAGPQRYEPQWPGEAAGGGEPAWGLLAARLDDTDSRERFVNAFWSSDRATGAPGMDELLAESRPTPAGWRKAVRDFRKAEREAAELMNKRATVFSQVTALPHAERERTQLEQEQQRARQVVADLEERITLAERPLSGLDHAVADGEREWRDHLVDQPGRWRTLFARGRLREWKDRDSVLAAALAQAQQRLYASRGTLAHLQEMHASARRGMNEHEDRLAALHDQVSSAQGAIRRARRDLADALPIADWWDNEQRRELRTPWTDAAWNAARTRLFLAALDLHRAFLAAEADRMRKNLQAAMDVLRGGVPVKAPKQAVLAAWQSLFFVVPLVSTTLASFDRVFSHLDREALGWLFVEEAGQLAPQRAVGAIWRAKRAVVVGDPFQREPVAAVPPAAEQAVRRHFGASETWLPGATSAQRLADRASRYGTTAPAHHGRLWVGVPLRVHRRCDEPMFGIFNAVGCGGRLINDVPPRDQVQPTGYPPPPESKWIDIRAGLADGHWVPDEGEELRFVLRRLRRQCGISGDRVRVISPLRQVAERLEHIAAESPGVAAGTVDTASGNGTDIVIVVLGGDYRSEGVRKRAAEKPNFVNVAVSHARRRLYVIGNHSAWSTHRHFDALAAGLPVTSSIRPVRDLVELEPGEAAETS